MAKMWAGRTAAETDKRADDFNSSIRVDCRMYREDIEGSVAHAAMLGRCGIIDGAEAALITEGLLGILSDIEEGRLAIDETAEDIHMFVEAELTARLGEVGKKLHTARSRNDQVALDFRMTLRREIDTLRELLSSLILTLAELGEEHAETVMPGYTHLQRAQPIVFGQQLLAYAYMLLRDRDRLADCRRRMNLSPIGSCALAGTTYPTDRRYEAAELGFSGVVANSMDGVSDRDFAVELLSDLSLLMVHLSRFAEELILFSSWEFKFIELSDAYTTGSSIMPQKKNPDMAELIRGKSGRVFGDLVALLTTLKGLPLAYNKDMQEDKEGVFDAVDTAKACLEVLTPMLATMRVNKERMLEAAKGGFIAATDLADYLVGRGLPFRSAYKTAGQIVALCIAEGKSLDTLTLDEYRGFSPLFEEGVYAAIDLLACVSRRTSLGGTSPDSVRAQVKEIREILA